MLSWSLRSSCRRRFPYRYKTTFVSKYNQGVQPQVIVSFLESRGIHEKDMRVTDKHVVLRECPLCEKPTSGRADNLYKLHIMQPGGAFFCHRCASKGSWHDLKRKLKGDKAEPVTSIQKAPAGDLPLPMPSPRLQALYSTQLLDQPNKVLEYLTKERGINQKTLRKYGVGRAEYSFPSDKNKWEKAECVTFPWLLTAEEVQVQEMLRGVRPQLNKDDPSWLTRRIKVRAVENKGWQRLDPPGGGWGLFGWHTVPPDTQEIVITEGEYDCLAVWQATGIPAISFPNGCRSLPPEILPLLERIPNIILWMDHDGPGQEGAQVFAKKIGRDRCKIVPAMQDGVKDANDALRMGADLEAMIRAAKSVPHERVVDFSHLREDVKHQILNPDFYAGVALPSLPQLTKILSGIRRGELTVLTGPTGAGKVRL